MNADLYPITPHKRDLFDLRADARSRHLRNRRIEAERYPTSAEAFAAATRRWQSVVR